MRTKRWPGLDAPTQEYTDLCGPFGEDVRGLDRLIGEGVVDLPMECRDPLDLLIEAEEQSIPTLYEANPFNIAVMDERTPYQILLEHEVETILELPEGFRPTSGARVIVWHAEGYEKDSDPSLRNVPRFACATASRLLEELRYRYSR